MIKVQPETLVGEEVTRQMERKMAKEDLLELDAGYTYDEEMKKELEQACWFCRSQLLFLGCFSKVYGL